MTEYPETRTLKEAKRILSEIAEKKGHKLNKFEKLPPCGDELGDRLLRAAYCGLCYRYGCWIVRPEHGDEAWPLYMLGEDEDEGHEGERCKCADDGEE